MCCRTTVIETPATTSTTTSTSWPLCRRQSNDSGGHGPRGGQTRARSGRNQFDVGEIRAHVLGVPCKQAQTSRRSMSPDEEIGQRGRPRPALASVIEKRARHEPRRRPGKSEAYEPNPLECALQAILAREADRHLGVDHLVDRKIVFGRKLLQVLLRPFSPRGRSHDVEQNARIHERGQSSSPRVKRNTSSALRPPSALSRRRATSREPSLACANGRTNAPSSVATTSTSAPGP